MPVLPAVEDIQAHHHATGRLCPAYIPVPAPTRRHRQPTSNIRRLQILPNGSRPLFTLARSHSPAGHYGRDGSPSPALWVDILLRMPVNHHQRPGPAIRIAAVPFPGQHLQHPSLTHDSFPSSCQRPRGADASVTQGRHNVPGARTMDRCPSPRPPRHAYSFKEDLQASVAELVYREMLRIPGELLAASPTTSDQFKVITQLRHHFKQLWPVPALRHASPAVFIHKDLADSTHVFLRQDAVWRPLNPPYSSPPQGPGLHEETTNRHKRPTCHGVN